MATQREMHLLDVRVADRNMKSGLLDRNNYTKYIKDLPDVSDKAEPISEHQPLEPWTDEDKAKAAAAKA